MSDRLTKLRANGYYTVSYPSHTKFWYEREWQLRAFDTCRPYNPLTPNVGVMANGLVVPDFDVTTDSGFGGTLAGDLAEWCLRNWGPAPIRYRSNSSKLLMVYRALHGDPHKRSVKNTDTKDLVEVLGHNNQFLAYGIHPSGVNIEWLDAGLTEAEWHRDKLTPVSDYQIEDLLQVAARKIGATVRPLTPITTPMPLGDGNDIWPLVDVESALDAIPNYLRDWGTWFAICAATHAVTDGSAEGYALFEQWSAKCGANNTKTNHAKWRSLSDADGFFTGGTLVHHARMANPNWKRPSEGLSEVPRLF